MSVSLRSALNRMFTRDGRELGAWEIVKWWELRRVAYNLVVGGTGLAGLIVLALFWPDAPAGDPEAGDPPFLLALGIVS
ncbi:MAG: hypothetical protein RLZZ15_3069, partial [Verrucomicrobiota bacterium]